MTFLRFGPLVLIAAISQAQLPNLRIPEPFGINVHYLKNPERELNEIYDAGFRVVRIDIPWNRAERNMGSFDFSEIEPLVLGIAAHKMRPLIILHSSNPLYETSLSWTDANKVRKQAITPPQHSESRKAFALFAGRAAKHFEKENPIWEIWNEPDTSGFWPPEPNADSYGALATEACHAIKTAVPAATVIAPGAAVVPKPAVPDPPFLKAVLDSGLAACIDAVSVHPYLWVDQLEWTPVMWGDLRRLITRTPHSPSAVSSEWGLSTYKTPAHSGESDDTQASYLARMMLLNFADNIQISVWYDWRDDGDDPANPEDRYGLTTTTGSVKPAYRAMTTLTRALAGNRFQCRVPSDDSTQLLLSDSSGKNNTLVIWANHGLVPWKADPANTLTAKSNLTWISAVDLFGDPVDISRQGDRPAMRGFQPFYVKVDVKSAQSACEQNGDR